MPKQLQNNGGIILTNSKPSDMEEIKIMEQKEAIRAMEKLSKESGMTIYEVFMIVLTMGLNEIKTNLFKTSNHEKKFYRRL